MGKTQEERNAAYEQVRRELGVGRMGTGPDAAPLPPRRAGSKSTLASPEEWPIPGPRMYEYGDIWARPGLPLRSRSFVSIAVLAALDHEEELYDQVNNALNLGITPDEISEALLQVAVYAGVSAWASALSVVREVFEVRGILAVGTDGTVGAVAPMNDEERRAAQLRVTTAFGLYRVGHGPDARPLEALPGPAAVASRPRMSVEGEIAGIQGDFGLAEVWARQGLDLRTRSLMTLGMLQVLREPDHLHLHVNNALNVGITPDEINEVFAQAGVYGGVSSWNNAVMVARDVFIQHGILEGSTPG